MPISVDKMEDIEKTTAGRFEQIVGLIVRSFNYLSLGILVCLMFFTVADVVLRYVFDMPIAGSIEIYEVGFATIVLLGWSYTALVKGHISVTLLVSKLSTNKQCILDIFSNLFAVAVLSLITWQGFDRAIYIMGVGETTDIHHIPIYPFRFVVSLGAGLMCLVIITHIVESAKKITQRS